MLFRLPSERSSFEELKSAWPEQCRMISAILMPSKQLIERTDDSNEYVNDKS